MTTYGSVRAGGKPLTGEQVKYGLIDAARRLGYLVHVIDDSRRVDSGWPDILCAGFGVVIAMECKSPNEQLRPGSFTRTGRGLPSQSDWLRIIAETNGALAFVVRPAPEDVRPSYPWTEIDYDGMLTVLTRFRDHAVLGATS